MRSRWIRITFALLWLAWTGVIIPGHTRGVIPVAGSDCHGAARDCCAGGRDSLAGNDHKPSPKSPSNCAICTLAVKLTTPPSITFCIRPTGMVETANVGDAAQSSSLLIILPYETRGPPVDLS